MGAAGGFMKRDFEEHLLNPPPGSAAERARDLGVDLTQLIENLKLTPTERLEKLQRRMIEMEARRSVAGQQGSRPEASQADD